MCAVAIWEGYVAFERDLRRNPQEGPVTSLRTSLACGSVPPGGDSVTDIAAPPPESFEQPDVHSSSPEYAKRFSGPTGMWMLERQEQGVLQALAGLNGRTVLELGGGHAQIAPRLVRDGYDVTVRGSTPECSLLLAPLIEENACRFSVGSLLDTEFPDKSFDVVICLRQISHFTQWGQLVREATRLARELVIIDYPPSAGFNMLYGPLYPLKKLIEGKSTRTYRCFTVRELNHAFGSQGFEPDKSMAQFFLPMVMHRRMKNRQLSTLLEKCFSALGLTTVLGSPIIASFKRK